MTKDNIKPLTRRGILLPYEYGIFYNKNAFLNYLNHAMNHLNRGFILEHAHSNFSYNINSVPPGTPWEQIILSAKYDRLKKIKAKVSKSPASIWKSGS